MDHWHYYHSSSGWHECLYKISWESMEHLSRYFNHNHVCKPWSGARGQTQQIEVIIIRKCRCNPFKKGWENSAFFKNGGPIYRGTSIEIPTATQLVCLRDAHLFSSIKMIVLFCSGWVEIIQGRYVFVRSLWYLVKHTVKAQHLWYEIIASINPDSTSDWHVKPNTVGASSSLPNPLFTPSKWLHYHDKSQYSTSELNSFLACTTDSDRFTDILGSYVADMTL